MNHQFPVFVNYLGAQLDFLEFDSKFSSDLTYHVAVRIFKRIFQKQFTESRLRAIGTYSTGFNIMLCYISDDLVAVVLSFIVNIDILL